MGYEDRDYYREGHGGGQSMWAWLNGSFSIGRWFGIDVRVHATLLIFIGLTLLLTPNKVMNIEDRIASMTVLFGIVLLHEFGHCFASRSVGGNPRQIIMHPLGGLAYADAPPTAWAQFVTVAGGPLVNVAICAISLVGIWLTVGTVSFWNPFRPLPPVGIGASDVGFYFWWVFIVSYILLLFNLAPVFPLDGGQLTRSLLWMRLGYYRGSLIAAVIGMAGSIAMGLIGLVSGSFVLAIIGLWCFLNSASLRQQLKAAGPWAFQEMDAPSYASSLRMPRESHRSSARNAEKQRQSAQAEQEKIDRILDKVSSQGMQSLTWFEKRTLRQATERQRKR